MQPLYAVLKYSTATQYPISLIMINVCIRVFHTGGMGEGDGVPSLAENLIMPLLQEKSLPNQIFIPPAPKVHPPQLNNSFYVIT